MKDAARAQGRPATLCACPVITSANFVSKHHKYSLSLKFRMQAR